MYKLEQREACMAEFYFGCAGSRQIEVGGTLKCIPGMGTLQGHFFWAKIEG